MSKATQDLRKEHDAILFVLQILDEMMRPDGRDEETLLRYYGEVVFFLRTFADKCHHGKEESFLFKAMEQKGVPENGGPIGVMLQEHAQGREYIARMSQSHGAGDGEGFRYTAGQYRDLLKAHIEKENTVLFQIADEVLGEEEQERLFDQFEQFEETVIGHGVHEQLHAMIDAWAEAFEVE